MYCNYNNVYSYIFNFFFVCLTQKCFNIQLLRWFLLENVLNLVITRGDQKQKFPTYFQNNQGKKIIEKQEF